MLFVLLRVQALCFNAPMVSVASNNIMRTSLAPQGLPSSRLPQVRFEKGEAVDPLRFFGLSSFFADCVPLSWSIAWTLSQVSRSMIPTWWLST